MKKITNIVDKLWLIVTFVVTLSDYVTGIKNHDTYYIATATFNLIIFVELMKLAHK